MVYASRPQPEPKEMPLSIQRVSLTVPFIWPKNGFKDLFRAPFEILFGCLGCPLVMLITLGFLTGFLGLIYTAPIVGHATSHA